MGNMRLMDLAKLQIPLLDQHGNEASGKEPAGSRTSLNHGYGMDQYDFADFSNDLKMTDGNNGGSLKTTEHQHNE
eukprot:8772682-Karenia_brevis.AAC.1